MSVMRIIKRKENITTDHYSGKKLYEFSLSENEFQLLVDMECAYSAYKTWSGIGIESLRTDDKYASKSNLINFVRGLKYAFDTIVETEDGYRLGLLWQSTLY